MSRSSREIWEFCGGEFGIDLPFASPNQLQEKHRLLLCKKHQKYILYDYLQFSNIEATSCEFLIRWSPEMV
jgi:hypothetical protein